MPGGRIGIRIADDYAIRMTGTVNQVADGLMRPELFMVKV
jgi:diaminopimelate epimerase